MAFSGLKKRAKIVIILILLVAVAGVGVVTAYFVRYSGTGNAVCKHCHPELFNLWQNSKGHPPEKTRCYQCHSQKVELLPKKWDVLAHARDQLVPPLYVADDALTALRCLDCHQNVLDLSYRAKKNTVKFTHRYHLAEGINCVDCHRWAGHEYQAGGTNRPTASDCVRCHAREFEGPPKSLRCLNCHEVILAPGKTW